MPDPRTVEPGVLTVGCGDLDALPLFGKMDADGHRDGYEPAAAALVAERMGLALRWVPLEWIEFYPALHDGRVDAIWCGQGIIPEREALAAFTRPYAVFDESLVVRPEFADRVKGPDDCGGLRIGAIAGSTNMKLTETFPGVVAVPFDGATEDVYGDMIAATRSGDVDGFVDDDVVMVPLDREPDLHLAFTVPTRNRWGIAVRHGEGDLLEAIDGALAAAIADGSLASAWHRWMPDLTFPLDA
jgi:polar amino acid transport system substrate-binding protein